tara:strand:- start:907 stop:1149 length:243 start_codon:yes stop_codon:yes gene_type:complete
MAIQGFIHYTACSMLGVKELTLDLRNYLDDVEMYANLVDGTVASRQVVAIALASYRRLRTLENDVNTLDWNKLRMRGERA